MQHLVEFVEAADLLSFTDEEPVAKHGNGVVAAGEGPALLRQPAGRVEAGAGDAVMLSAAKASALNTMVMDEQNVLAIWSAAGLSTNRPLHLWSITVQSGPNRPAIRMPSCDTSWSNSLAVWSLSPARKSEDGKPLRRFP